MNKILRKLAVTTQRAVGITEVSDMDNLIKMYSRCVGTPNEPETYSNIHGVDIEEVFRNKRRPIHSVTALDIGCGRGYAIRDLCKMGADAYGTSKHLFEDTIADSKERIVIGSLDCGVPDYYQNIPKKYFDIVLSTFGDIYYAMSHRGIHAVREFKERNNTPSVKLEENKKWLGDVLQWINSVSKDDAFISIHTDSFYNAFDERISIAEKILDENGFLMKQRLTHGQKPVNVALITRK